LLSLNQRGLSRNKLVISGSDVGLTKASRRNCRAALQSVVTQEGAEEREPRWDDLDGSVAERSNVPQSSRMRPSWRA